MNDDLYREELMEHYRYPRNKKKVENPDFEAANSNTGCGDFVSISGKVDNGKISDIGFEGVGCVMSQAVASLMTDFFRGKEVDTILALPESEFLKEMKLNVGPARSKCVLLPFRVLKIALDNYRKMKKGI